MTNDTATGGNPQIRQVPYWEVKALWPVVGPMLEKVIALQDEWSLQGLYERLIAYPLDTCPMQLWHVEGHGALVTQMTAYPQTGVRKCLIFMAGGERADACLDTTLATIERWAVEYFRLQSGRDKMIIHGRAGWRRLLEPLGYELKTICLEKPI